MTLLCKVPVGRLIDRYCLTAFVETGTEGGDAIGTALKYNFQRIVSCECDQFNFDHSAKLFARNRRVFLFHDFTRNALPVMLGLVKDDNVLFWLDAHYPPIGKGYTKEDAFPLRDEIRLIRENRDCTRDVIIIDDAELYDKEQQYKPRASEVGQYYGVPDIYVDEIVSNFTSHDFTLAPFGDEGVLMFTPKM